MDANLRNAIRYLKDQALPAFTEEFRKNQEALSEGTIEHFYEAAVDLISKVHYELCNFFNFEEVSEFSSEVIEKIWRNTIYEMNGALPPEHPYILCMVVAPDEPIECMALHRGMDPILAESLSTHIIVIKHLREDEDPENGGKMEYIFPTDSLRSNSF